MEIEAKILLTKDQYFTLYDRFKSLNGVSELKKDSYYSKYGSNVDKAMAQGEPLIRIRSTCVNNVNSHFLTLKKKQIVDGVEKNDERETELDDNGKDVILSLFEGVKLQNWFNKTKESIGVFYKSINPKFINCKPVHCELEIIDNKYYCLEIEDTENDIDDVVKEAFEYFGLDFENRCSKSWEELLKDK